jgi:nucleoside-diphosphate-sugar epimerase
MEKSYAGCYLNSVVSTRNLLDAVCGLRDFKRLVNVSSLSVYSNFGLRRNALLDERCELERDCVSRHEPYAYAKLKQDELVIEYSARHGIPYVILRPGAVYGPGQPELSARVGINTFGIFLHLGGRNRIPLTHVDNCARAIVLAGTVRGIDGEVINVIDDESPSSREFLARYQREVGRLPHISVPYRLFYVFCLLWEVYSRRSAGQLPPVFNRRRCSVYWKGNQYSNRKLKELLGWNPAVSLEDGLSSYFEYLRTVRASSC